MAFRRLPFAKHNIFSNVVIEKCVFCIDLKFSSQTFFFPEKYSRMSTIDNSEAASLLGKQCPKNTTKLLHVLPLSVFFLIEQLEVTTERHN